MIVDYQSHWYSNSYLDSLVERADYPRAARDREGNYVFEQRPGTRWVLAPHFTTLDLQLADMDANGVDVMVMSPNILGEVGGVDVAEARETLEFLNEETARAQRLHPERVLGLAMLPMQDASAAIELLDRAITTLGLRGVCILSNVDGRPIATPDTLPIYQRIEELAIPVFLHPAHHSIASGAGLPWMIEIGLSWMFDTSAAALSLIYSGTLDACPRLTVVHPHLGGTLPYVLGRVVEVEQMDGRIGRSADRYLRERFYVDCVSRTPGALALAIDTYGPERVLYASDYPWGTRSATRAFLDDNLDSSAALAVMHDNRLPDLAPLGLR
jgi:predicted TIM-barrel fold metal-dependent hydrolase